MSATDESTVPLSAAWLAAGAMLFCVALGTPFVVLNYLPDPRPQTKIASQANASDVKPLVVQADDAPDYPEMQLAAEAGAMTDGQMGSLATLIDAQGEMAHTTQAPAVRQMILDAITVDLESSRSVNALEDLHVPIRDCSAPNHAPEAFLISAGSEVETALSKLRGLPSRVPYQQIAGPTAFSRSAQFEGMRVEFCYDLVRISAVEILPLATEAQSEPSTEVTHLQGPTASRAAIGQDPLRAPVATMAVDPIAISQPVVARERAPTEPLPTAEIAASLSVVIGLPKTSTPEVSPRRYEVDGLLAAGSDEISVERPMPGQVSPYLRAFRRTSGPPQTARVRYDAPAKLLAFHGRAFEVSPDVAFESSEPTMSGASATKRPVRLANPEPVLISQAVATHVPSDATSEKNLNLDRRARRQAQVRLALLGYDPKGIDGIFGEGTRSAIAALQAKESLIETGYLDAFTLALLNEKSETNYANWRAKRAKQRAKRLVKKRQPKVMPSAPQRIAASPPKRRAPGCARDKKGVIISNQSFDCDLNVLRESLGSLFGSAG